MTEWEAIEKRVSCRSYQDRMIKEDLLQEIRNYIAELNSISGLRFQLRVSESQGTPAVKMSAAMFSGPVYAYAALVGGDDPLSAEKVGYFGQKLVLFAEQLGVSTCWVAGTYDASSIDVETGEGEKVWDIIPLGYASWKTPMKQKLIRSTLRRKDRKPEQFLESDIAYSAAPEWVRTGIEAVLKGPSAVNQQPVNILYKEGKVFAKLRKSGHGLEYNDLGIAKKQFEAGAAHAGVSGRFDWGDEGQFIIG